MCGTSKSELPSHAEPAIIHKQQRRVSFCDLNLAQKQKDRYTLGQPDLRILCCMRRRQLWFLLLMLQGRPGVGCCCCCFR